jgi:type IV secretory pathway protease TraF
MDHAIRSPRGLGFVRLGKDVAMTLRTSLRPHPGLSAGLLALAALLAGAGSALAAWKTEPGVAVPSYAVAQPDRATVNVDSLVLMCEPTGAAPVLQLQLYLADDGPLLPNGASSDALKGEPRAELAVDGRVFPVRLLFADDHVVVADAEGEPVPFLSDGLLDALQKGRRLALRLDLLAEPPGHAAAFDGLVEVDLSSAAVAAVRRCAGTPALSFATH